MEQPVTTEPPTGHTPGRQFLWFGIAAFAVGLGGWIAQFLLRILTVPWYTPILGILGVGLLVIALRQRRSVPRIISLGLVGLLTAFEWYFILAGSLVPVYAGTAQVGQPLPPFHTSLADGRSLTNADLQQGSPSILLFFRGRW